MITDPGIHHLRRKFHGTLMADVLEAARADMIPEGVSGLWTVKRFRTGRSPEKESPRTKRKTVLPPGTYTQLYRMTLGTLQTAYGDLVMQDTPEELATHLQFMLKARGRVLVTGLGLGCVARGLLANPAVASVTVVERDGHVLDLVGTHLLDLPRLNIVAGEAVAFCEKLEPHAFDCAWHDLWSDEEAGDPNLTVMHGKAICATAGKVRMQGAWQLPAVARQMLRGFLGK